MDLGLNFFWGNLILRNKYTYIQNQKHRGDIFKRTLPLPNKENKVTLWELTG